MENPPDHLLSKFRDQVELFGSFTNEEILTVLKISSDKLTLNEGEIIFREGSPGNKMYVILAGEVAISRSLGNAAPISSWSILSYTANEEYVAPWPEGSA